MNNNISYNSFNIRVFKINFIVLSKEEKSMRDIKLSRTITEVLEILEHMDKTYIEKLPKKFVEFLQNNQDISYIPKFDYTKNLQNCDISKETKALLGMMYLKYWSYEEQKKEYLQVLEENQKKYQAEINEKYNTDNLFKNSNKCEEKVQMIEYKESIFRKIMNKIKLFFKIK